MEFDLQGKAYKRAASNGAPTCTTEKARSKVGST
jgi:hypothetical protein